MASLIPSGSASGTGSMTLAAPVTNSNQTATLPDATGTVMVSGNMPAFSAYSNANQNISNNTSTKVALNAETFDTANCFDSTTNYRFTPTVAGYYQINAGIYFAGTAMTNIQLYIYKNGSQIFTNLVANGISVSDFGIQHASLVYLNGSTDYVELYGYSSAASGNKFNGGTNPCGTYMSGSLVRGA